MEVDILAYDGVLHVQVRLFGVNDEELRSIRIRTAISHTHYTSSVVLVSVCVSDETSE